jgi:hypothetical protein
MWGMLFGAIGFGFFLYGKNQKLVVPLCVVPYFIADVYVLVLIGVVSMAIPYFVWI